MSKTLRKIAQQLRDLDKKVQLIYGFNGMGKTRLSREFKELSTLKSNENEELETAFAVDYYPHVILSSKGKIKHYPGLHSIQELHESII
jgi:hypothetical protein